MHERGIKNQKKHFSHLDSENDPKKLPRRAPIGLLNRFKTHPKRYLNSMRKYDEKLKPKIQNLGSKWTTFPAFLARKIELQRHLEPSWAPKLKIHQKRGAEVLKIDTYCADIDLETNKNEEF